MKYHLSWICSTWFDMVHSKMPYLSYVKCCLELKLFPLSYHHEFLNIVSIFKCLHCCQDVDSTHEVWIASAHSPLRSAANGLLLCNHLAHTEHFVASYFNCISHMWNILPSEICNGTSLSFFTVKLHEFYMGKVTLNTTYKIMYVHCHLQVQWSLSYLISWQLLIENNRGIMMIVGK